MLDEYIETLKDEMVKETCNLINIPSVSEDDQEHTSTPFGKNANDALEYALNLGKKLGFRTKNVDGYCGYIEFGEGEGQLSLKKGEKRAEARKPKEKVTYKMMQQ